MNLQSLKRSSAIPLTITQSTLLLTLLIALSSTQAGCDKKSEEPVPEVVVEEKAVVEKPVDEKPFEEIASYYFNVPTLPGAEGLLTYDQMVTYYYPGTIEQAQDFFKKTKTPLEVFEDGGSLHVVGLSPHIGSAKISPMSRRARPLRVTVWPGDRDLEKKEEDQVVSHAEKKKADQLSARYASGDYFRDGNGNPVKRGTPVDLKLPNGELMAPGAKWGVGYIPPKGSYYDKPEFKANFGRPFGDWLPN